MILCGWCGHPTTDGPQCVSCGHAEPEKPWRQRGQTPPDAIKARLDSASRKLAERGRAVTDESLAEVLDVSPRTIGRWRQKMSG